MNSVVTQDGQVAIPKVLRDKLGLTPGSRVDLELASDGGLVIRPVSAATTRIARFAAAIGTATGGLTTDEVMAMTRGED